MAEITKDMAMKELARRELAKREAARAPQATQASEAPQAAPRSRTQEVFNKGVELAGKAIRMAPPVALQTLVTDKIQGRLFNNDPLDRATGALALGALDSASFGIPRAVAKKIIESAGVQTPVIEDKTAYNTGKILGLLAPGKMAQSIVSKVPAMAGPGIMKAVARASTEGAAVGFTTSPDEFTNLKQRIMQSGIGAGVGAAVAPLGIAASNLNKVINKSAQFAEKIRSNLFIAKKSFGDTFEKQLDDLIVKNPSKVVDLSQPFNKLKELSANNSRLVSDLKTGMKKAGVDADLIDGFIKNPESASQMTLNQARQIKQAVSKIPSIQSNLKKGKFANFSDTDIDLVDFADEVKQQQLSAFPELADINRAYSSNLEKYNLVKDKFKVGRLLDNIEKNFGDGEVRKIIKELLPKEVVAEMGGYRGAAKFLRAAGWVAATGVTGAALTAGGSAVYKALQR